MMEQRFDRAVAQSNVLDASFDLQGRCLATACEDGVVRLWNPNGLELISELRGHRRPALGVAWGGVNGQRFLASGAEDGQVIVWREGADAWRNAFEVNVTGAATAVAISQPVEQAHGGAVLLAVAGGDSLGVVTLLARRETNASFAEYWVQAAAFPAHPGGTIAVSWAPMSNPATMATGPATGRASNVAPAQRRMATGGADGIVRVWYSDARANQWTAKHDLTAGDGGAIRDVAWRPNVGIPSSVLASCTDRGDVAIWAQALDGDGHPWTLNATWRVKGDARRLKWSWGGEVIAVSVGDSESVLYREVEAGRWEEVPTL